MKKSIFKKMHIEHDRLKKKVKELQGQEGFTYSLNLKEEGALSMLEMLIEDDIVKKALELRLKIRLAELQYAISALTIHFGYTLDDMIIQNMRLLQEQDAKCGYKVRK